MFHFNKGNTTIGGIDYHFSYRMKDNKPELLELFDQYGEQPDDEQLLEQIEKEIWQAMS